MANSKRGKDSKTAQETNISVLTDASSSSSSASFVLTPSSTPKRTGQIDDSSTPDRVMHSNQDRRRHRHSTTTEAPKQRFAIRESQQHHDYKDQPYSLDTLIGGGSNSSSGGYDPDDYSNTSPPSFPLPHTRSMASNSTMEDDYEIQKTSSSNTSPYEQILEGKFSRPRRRAGASVQATHNNRHGKRYHRTDGSVASESSETSRFSRISSVTSNRFSSGFQSQQQLHQGLPQQQYSQQQRNQQHSSSYNSLFGLGTTQHTHTDNSTGSGSNADTLLQSSLSTPDAYEKHHHPNESSVSLFSLLYSHHQQHKSRGSPSLATSNERDSPISPTGFSPPNLPSLRLVVSELFIICSLHCRYKMRSIRKPCRRLQKRLFWAGLSIVAMVVLLVGWIVVDFTMDAIAVCTPPPESFASSNFASFLADAGVVTMTDMDDADEESRQRPLVEYYVHGRGIGHYARSVAIVERLNGAGIDVRMFLTRAAMWRAMHEDAKSMLMREDAHDVASHTTDSGAVGHQLHPKRRGKTTAISVASVTPNQNLADVLSTVVERVSGDCEVSASSGRYPQLVISDGDFPGMLRAELGGIPSVGIAHGQLFSIAQKPTWVKNVPILNRAWNKQGTLNYVSGGMFASWQIATHFCFLESKYATGTVARAPLRPEVLQMAEARKYARVGKMFYGKNHGLPQADRVRDLLLASTDGRITPNNVTTHNNDRMLLRNNPKRKLVICYFRDRNGEIVVKALLDAGFDVLLFDNGYYKDMVNEHSRYGAKWIVREHEADRKKYIRSGDDRRSLVDLANNETLPADKRLHRRLEEVLQRPDNSPKLIRVSDRSLFVPLMHVADGVASSAGSQLMSECIYSHMPLYALYREEDDEQRLNVELSHHMDAPCHRPLVFGTSFESLTYALKSNDTHYATHHNRSPILESLAAFIREVQSSRVSETYYRNVDLLTKGEWSNATDIDDGNFDDEDPFRGLPDAAAIILEIVKQVVQNTGRL